MNDLDQLDMITAKADEGAAAVDPQAQADAAAAAAAPDYGREAAIMVDMFAGLVTGYAPATAEVWTNPAKQRTAMALAPVLEKYGITFDALPCELLFAVVAGPLLWRSSKLVAMQMEMDGARAKAEAKKPDTPQPLQPDPAPGPSAAPAPPVHPQTKLYT